MATIKKRISKGGAVSYHVRVRLKGHPLQCGTFPNISKAREFVQLTEASMKEGRHFIHSEAKRHSMADLIDRQFKSEVQHS